MLQPRRYRPDEIIRVTEDGMATETVESDYTKRPGMGGMEIESLHHVSLPVTDLERSRRYYREVLALEELERPPFDFRGAWFRVGIQQLHLIVHPDSTFRKGKGLDSRDHHFAFRVANFRHAVEFLRSKGFREDAPDMDPMKMRVRLQATAGFPQIHILDPDRNVIELNCESLD